MTASGNILVVYQAMTWPMRSTINDHLYAFRRHSGYRVHYVNIAARKLPADLDRRDLDLVVFHTTFLSTRWHPDYFDRMCRRAAPLKGLGRHRVAMPQDEFIHTDHLGEFIREFEIDTVCSVAEASEWPKIYPSIDREKVHFETILTGYLDDRTLQRIERLAGDRGRARPTAIGYRAWHAAPWLGSHGFYKTAVAARFQAAAPAHGLSTDISTRPEDTLLGDAWFEHLARCKYVIGCEGGASILDTDGSVKACAEAYLAENPGAPFGDVKEACFADRDGELSLFAVSPRHLEACATRTCQVLIEGDYSGVLRAGEHYIAVKRDFSNLGEVLAEIKRDDRRAEIVERAYADVVASGRYSYRGMVDAVEAAALGPHRCTRPRSSVEDLALARNRVSDACSWATVAGRAWLYGLLVRVGRRVRDRILAPIKSSARRMLARVVS